MRTMLAAVAMSGTLALGGAAWACGDVADAHPDSFAQMTKPQSTTATAAPAKKAIEVREAAQRAAQPNARAARPAVAPVKVASRTPE